MVCMVGSREDLDVGCLTSEQFMTAFVTVLNKVSLLCDLRLTC